VCGRTPARSRLSLGALALVLVVVVALAGCGGGSRSASGSSGPGPASAGGDAEQIRTAINAVLASGDADQVCDRYTTSAYIQGAFGDVMSCKATVSAPGQAARSVQVSAVSVTGDKATAVAVPSGGPNKGQRLQVQLLKQGGVWKVDALIASVGL
jgi:hypothetical protein